MKLVVGLGNPGEKYKQTRHNVGWLVVDKLGKLGLKNVLFFKPDLFMNKSGVVVKKLMKKYPKVTGEDLYIVYDDLDIKLGEFKLSFGKGPRDHNGLKSIYEQIGTNDFWHVRVGIDNRMNVSFDGSGEDYVLSKWLLKEKEILDNVIERIVKELKDVLA